MKNTIYAVLIIIVATLMYMGVKSDPQNGGDEIVIGAPLSLAGTAATDGLSMKRGIDLAVDDLKAKGINVRIVYEDDATDAKQTISAVQKILGSEDVDAIIGPTWSFLHDAAAPIISQHKIVSYSPGNTSEFTVTKSPYLFFGAVKNARKITTATEWLKSMNAKKVAIIVDKSAWGESHIEPFTEAVKAVGAEAVLTERIPFGAERDTFPTILAKVKSTNADAILWTGYDEGAIILARKMQEMKLQTPLLSATNIPLGLVKNGVITIHPEDNMYYITTTISPEFGEKLFKKYNEYPTTYSDSAYDGVMLIVDGLQKKSPQQSLADYLHSGKTYKGYQTDYLFDQNGDISGGEWVVKRLQ